MSTFINILTLSRIFLAALIFILLISPDGYFLAFLLFLLAGVTDYFDGYLARKYNAVSQLGEILDPIADKILILFVLFGVAINLSSYLIGFIGALIITREIWVGALRDLNARNEKSEVTKVTFLAKIKTTVQLFTIFIYLFGLTFNNMLVLIVADILLFISFFITLYTGFIYSINTFILSECVDELILVIPNYSLETLKKSQIFISLNKKDNISLFTESISDLNNSKASNLYIRSGSFCSWTASCTDCFNSSIFLK